MIRKKEKNDSFRDVFRTDICEEDPFDAPYEKEEIDEDYPDLQYSAVLEGADAGDIHHDMKKEHLS